MRRALAVAAVAVAAPAFSADLVAALRQYTKEEYADARLALAGLAELGQAQAQAVYGQMLVRGQGGPVSLGAGFGWMQAAASNGNSESLAQLEKIKGNIAKLSAPEQAAAAAVARQFEKSALQDSLLPVSADVTGCERLTSARMIEVVLPEYPRAARRWAADADVMLRFRIGLDGLPREPQVLAAFPEGDLFTEPAIRGLLQSRYRPIAVDGRPVDWSFRSNIRFRIQGGGSLWDNGGVRKAVEMADAGVPAAQFLVGSAGMIDGPEFHTSHAQALKLLLRSAQAGHAHGQFWLADEIAARTICAPSPKAGRWLKLAAQSGDPDAQMTRARQILAAEPSADERAEARRLLIAAAESKSTFSARFAIGILASSPFDDVRDPATAFAAMKRIKDESYDQDPQTWEAYAAADAATGKFSEAASRQERALRLAREYRWNTSAIETRLADYRNRKPWTGDLYAVPPVPEPGPGPNRVAACNSSRPVPPCLRILSQTAPSHEPPVALE